MNHVSEPDWQAAEDRIVVETTSAIERFAREHPNEVCSCLAFAVDCCYGDVVLCFDTLQNSLAQAKRHQREVLKDWELNLGKEHGWEEAEYYLTRTHTHNRIVEYTPYPVDDFKYGSVSILHFDDWDEYFGSTERDDQERNPIGHVIVLMHNVVNRLVSSGVFEQLALSSPFRVGVDFIEVKEPGIIVMRILNWPDER